MYVQFLLLNKFFPLVEMKIHVELKKGKNKEKRDRRKQNTEHRKVLKLNYTELKECHNRKMSVKMA